MSSYNNTIFLIVISVHLQVKWYKDKRELSKYEHTMTYSDGVVTMEIVNCKVEDSGNYRCVASNSMGQDETSCVVIVEGRVSNSNISLTPTN